MSSKNSKKGYILNSPHILVDYNSILLENERDQESREICDMQRNIFNFLKTSSSRKEENISNIKNLPAENIFRASLLISQPLIISDDKSATDMIKVCKNSSDIFKAGKFEAIDEKTKKAFISYKYYKVLCESLEKEGSEGNKMGTTNRSKLVKKKENIKRNYLTFIGRMGKRSGSSRIVGKIGTSVVKDFGLIFYESLMNIRESEQFSSTIDFAKKIVESGGKYDEETQIKNIRCVGIEDFYTKSAQEDFMEEFSKKHVICVDRNMFRTIFMKDNVGDAGNNYSEVANKVLFQILNIMFNNFSFKMIPIEIKTREMVKKNSKRKIGINISNSSDIDSGINQNGDDFSESSEHLADILCDDKMSDDHHAPFQTSRVIYQKSFVFNLEGTDVFTKDPLIMTCYLAKLVCREMITKDINEGQYGISTIIGSEIKSHGKIDVDNIVDQIKTLSSNLIDRIERMNYNIDKIPERLQFLSLCSVIRCDEVDSANILHKLSGYRKSENRAISYLFFSGSRVEINKRNKSGIKSITFNNDKKDLKGATPNSKNVSFSFSSWEKYKKDMLDKPPPDISKSDSVIIDRMVKKHLCVYGSIVVWPLEFLYSMVSSKENRGKIESDKVDEISNFIVEERKSKKQKIEDTREKIEPTKVDEPEIVMRSKKRSKKSSKSSINASTRKTQQDSKMIDDDVEKIQKFFGVKMESVIEKIDENIRLQKEQIELMKVLRDSNVDKKSMETIVGKKMDNFAKVMNKSCDIKKSVEPIISTKMDSILEKLPQIINSVLDSRETEKKIELDKMMGTFMNKHQFKSNKRKRDLELLKDDIEVIQQSNEVTRKSKRTSKKPEKLNLSNSDSRFEDDYDDSVESLSDLDDTSECGSDLEIEVDDDISDSDFDIDFKEHSQSENSDIDDENDVLAVSSSSSKSNILRVENKKDVDESSSLEVSKEQKVTDHLLSIPKENLKDTEIVDHVLFEVLEDDLDDCNAENLWLIEEIKGRCLCKMGELCIWKLESGKLENLYPNSGSFGYIIPQNKRDIEIVYNNKNKTQSSSSSSNTTNTSIKISLPQTTEKFLEIRRKMSVLAKEKNKKNRDKLYTEILNIFKDDLNIDLAEDGEAFSSQNQLCKKCIDFFTKNETIGNIMKNASKVFSKYSKAEGGLVAKKMKARFKLLQKVLPSALPNDFLHPFKECCAECGFGFFNNELRGKGKMKQYPKLISMNMDIESMNRDKRLLKDSGLTVPKTGYKKIYAKISDQDRTVHGPFCSAYCLEEFEEKTQDIEESK